MMVDTAQEKRILTQSYDEVPVIIVDSKNDREIERLLGILYSRGYLLHTIYTYPVSIKLINGHKTNYFMTKATTIFGGRT